MSAMKLRGVISERKLRERKTRDELMGMLLVRRSYTASVNVRFVNHAQRRPLFTGEDILYQVIYRPVCLPALLFISTS